MVKKIKKKNKKPASAPRPQSIGWWVPFDAEGYTAVFINRREAVGDDSANGPVIMCCERAEAPYRALAPDLCTRIDTSKPQWGHHLVTWFDNGVKAMYFVLCDPNDADTVYQFGLPAEQARPLLMGHVPHDHYRRPEYRFVANNP